MGVAPNTPTSAPEPGGERVPTGIEGLDLLLQGGFPRGSLILIAGNAGTGKTALATQFLGHGATKYGEKGIYVTFAEGKEIFIHNARVHSGFDFERLQDEGRVKVIDMVPVREEAISAVLETILGEITAVGAKRLVVDPFTALALQKKIEARVLLRMFLGTIVRGEGCTTLLVDEVPMGSKRIGMGMEEFVADGVIVLKKSTVNSRPLRELSFEKMRGTVIQRPSHPFTLHKGFHVFLPFEAKPPKEPRRFEPIPDSEDTFSSGNTSLDRILGGGFRRGSIVLFDVDPDVPPTATTPLVLPPIFNFVEQKRGAFCLPTLRFGIQGFRIYAFPYIGKSAVKKHIRLMSLGGRPSEEREEPWLIGAKGESVVEDWDRFLRSSTRMGPAFIFVGLDRMEYRYGAEESKRGLEFIVAKTKEIQGLTFLFGFTGRGLTEDACTISDLHFSILKQYQTMILYGKSPDLGVYNLKVDVSKGYPLAVLTPIV